MEYSKEIARLTSLIATVASDKEIKAVVKDLKRCLRLRQNSRREVKK